MHVSRQRVSRWYPYGAVNSFPSLFVLSKFPLNDNRKPGKDFSPPIINNTENHNSNFEHVTILIIGRSSISSILLANLSRYFLRPFDRLIISRNFDHARLLRYGFLLAGAKETTGRRRKRCASEAHRISGNAGRSKEGAKELARQCDAVIWLVCDTR